MFNKIEEAKKYIVSRIDMKPKVGIILGSGLGSFVDRIENKIEIPYSDIPHFPTTTVSGHEGKLIFGYVGKVYVVAMQGRFHYYEGYSMKEVTFPTYVLKSLEIDTLIISNAAGGINPKFKKGGLMIIRDHINFMGTNPLIGANDERFGPRFPDMTEIYSKELREKAKKVADSLGIEYEEGVYIGVTGPSYETGAEIRAFRVLGGDAIGMSTVPEAITAKYLGINILGISCITNMATGLAKTSHSHEEVVKIANLVEDKFCTLVENIILSI